MPIKGEKMDTKIEQNNGIIGDSKYTYYAFISYRRLDSKWAKWLKNRLQAYRLPNKTHSLHQNLPRRFNPIFLDKTNLTPGLLDEGLKKEVQASKYLIVICSKNAHEKSQYIDEEIDYFLDGGGDVSRIIPFIIDDSKTPEEDCFPRRLQELCREKTILGANVNDSGKNDAFLKVVAYMHGLKLEELSSEDSRRKKRTYFWAAVISFFILVVMGISAYKCWDYYVPKTKYYLDYTEKYGVPVGIRELSSADIKAMAEHYTIVSSKNKIRELRHENSHGRLIAHERYGMLDRPVLAKYDYDEKKELRVVTYYDENNKEFLALNYVNKNTVNFTSSNLSSEYSSGAFLDSNVSSNSTSNDEEDTKAEITRYLIDYDENGFVKEIRYSADQVYNYVALDKYGVSGLKYKRDSKGRAIGDELLVYTGTKGVATNADDYQVLGNKEGIYSREYKYDDEDNLVEISFWGDNHTPILCKDGWFKKSISCDNKHNIISEFFYDDNDSLTDNKSFYAECRTDFNGDGDVIERWYYNASEVLCINDEGVAGEKKVYDAEGFLTEISYWGTDKKPVFCNEGYSSVIIQNDQEGNPITIDYYGISGTPILYNGFNRIIREYDNLGNIVSESYWNNDAPALTTHGYYAKQLCDYDEDGRLIKESYFGLKGEPVWSYAGSSRGACSSASYEYDEKGNEIKRSFFGLEGEPIISMYGAATMQAECNEQGNYTAVYYLGTDGNLILCSENYAYELIQYDKCGREIQRSKYDTDGRPILCSDGYASVLEQYDNKGNRVRLDFLGTDGRPINAFGDLYATAITDYDLRGNPIKEWYFDSEGMPALCAGGYAYTEMTYDK